MNIKITYNWLLEYLDTDADPYEIQKFLSLCGPSIERVEKKGDDYVFDIETTSNRVDMASVFGIAQEAQAILPQFGKKASLKQNPLSVPQETLQKLEPLLPIEIELTDNMLASRIAAVVLSNIHIKSSDELIRQRLEMCDITIHNNVIDISNYLRLSLGLPCHIFDYDQIGNHRMIIRESKKGEVVVTLDKDEVTLPGNDIVIEDGAGKLIDQPGILGAFNSSVQNETKNIVLFVPIFNGKMVRRTSMLTGKRSDSATYFEKGLDEERVIPSLYMGVNLLKKHATASVASDIIDIYPSGYKEREISVELEFIKKRIGIDITLEQCKKILENLGFKLNTTVSSLRIGIPSWRFKDISINEDIIEEVARIYGYYRLPNNLPPAVFMQQPVEFEQLFSFQHHVNHFLKNLGLHESMNYSMISESLINNMNLSVHHHLKLANTISEELQYLRTSLLPSLVKNIKDNAGKKDELKFFEIAKVYYPQAHDLPKEIYKLACATNTSFADLKGIIEALLAELRITNYELRSSDIHIFSKHEVVDFVVDGGVIGSVGKLSADLQNKNKIKTSVYLASFDVLSLIQHTKLIPQYKSINPFATIKLDLTTSIDVYADFVKKAHAASPLLQQIELVSTYKNNITVRLYFSSSSKNLTHQEAEQELEKIKKINE